MRVTNADTIFISIFIAFEDNNLVAEVVDWTLFAANINTHICPRESP
jgi:hypothetical protein